MADEIKRLFEKNRVQLVKYILLDSRMWFHLRADGGLSTAQKKKIELNNTEAEQIGKLLDFLGKGPDKAVISFCKALRATDQKHIVDGFLTPSTSNLPGGASQFEQEPEVKKAKTRISSADSDERRDNSKEATIARSRKRNPATDAGDTVGVEFAADVTRARYAPGSSDRDDNDTIAASDTGANSSISFVECLKENRVGIVEKLDDLPYILEHLLSIEAISKKEKQLIMAKDTGMHKVRALLDNVDRKGEEACRGLVVAMRDTDQLKLCTLSDSLKKEVDKLPASDVLSIDKLIDEMMGEYKEQIKKKNKLEEEHYGNKVSQEQHVPVIINREQKPPDLQLRHGFDEFDIEETDGDCEVVTEKPPDMLLMHGRMTGGSAAPAVKTSRASTPCLYGVDSGSDGNKSDRVQKLTRKNTRHASIQVSVDATDAETQSDLQLCETSYDIKLTTESNFVICGLITEFPLAVYIPRGTISTQDEALMTVTITCSMTQPECNSEDDDVQHIGPTLSFTPHRYNFLRPILVFMYLPERYHSKKKDHEYAVLYSDTDRDEEPIWEDVTGFDHYPVSGAVIPLSNLAIIRFTHFCSLKVVDQPSEKACVANVFAFVDYADPEVCITCLFCPERHTGQRRYKERLANIKGSLETSEVFSVSNANTPVSLEVTSCHPSWTIEHEADKTKIVAHSLVWTGKYPHVEIFFIPVDEAECLPPTFLCRLQLKHDSPPVNFRVKIPVQERSEVSIASNVIAAIKEPVMSPEQEEDSKTEITSPAVTGMGELSKEQRPQVPKQWTSGIKEKPQKSHYDIIEKELDELIKFITLDVELWAKFRSKGVFTLAQEETIKAVGGSADQIYQILNIMMKSSTEKFDNFCKALKETRQHHIIDKFLTPTEDSTEADFSKENIVALLKMVTAVLELKPFIELYGADDDLEGLQKHLVGFLKHKEQQTGFQS